MNKLKSFIDGMLSAFCLFPPQSNNKANYIKPAELDYKKLNIEEIFKKEIKKE